MEDMPRWFEWSWKAAAREKKKEILEKKMGEINKRFEEYLEIIINEIEIVGRNAKIGNEKYGDTYSKCVK